MLYFYYGGGTLGVPRSLVTGVWESDVPYIEASDPEEASTSDETPEGIHAGSMDTGGEGKSINGGTAGPDQKPDLEHYEKRNRELRVQLDGSLQEYREATHEKDSEAKEEARENIRTIARQIYSLSDQVKDSFGSLPEGWWQGADGIGGY